MHLFGTHTSGEVTRPPFAGSVLVPAIFKYNHFVEEEFMFPKAGFEEDRLNPEIISSKIMSSRASYNHFIPVLKRKYKRKNAKSLRLKKETNDSFQCVSCEAIANDKIKQHSVRPCNRILRKTSAKKAASNIQTENKTQNPEDEVDMLDLNEVIRNELKPYNFCFEHVPANEPWFRVFTRQDESKEEIFEYYGNTVYRELPYEMGPLPPKQGKCNLCQTADEKVIVPKKESIQVLKQPKVEPAEIQENKLPSHGKIKKLASKGLLSIEMRRKSPREHASTLAIMSCLLQETQNNLTDNYECDIDVNEEDVSERSVSKTDHKLESKVEVDKSPIQKCEDKNVSLKNNLETVKRQPSPCHKSNSGKKSEKDSSVHSSKKKNSRLTEDLVGVKQLERDIDYHLLHSFEEWNLENSINLALQTQKSVFTHDIPLDDRSFDSRTKLSNSNKVASRLKIFNFFSTGKKRKNKTGWPKKKRVASRQHFVKFTNRPNGFSNIDKIDNCERLEKTINENDCTPSIGIETEKKYSSNAAFSNQDMNVVKNDFICKTDDSELLAASSDSLDTVFDVGSQIKTEDQQKIIASSKYNTRNNSFVRSKQICVSKVKKRIKGKGKKKRFNRIKVEKFEAIQDNFKNSSIPNVIKRNEEEPVSPAASIISTRGLRKPRGCWYRER